MAFCPNCGNQIPAGATACPVCAGAAQATPPAASYSAPSYAAPNASAQTQVGGLTENAAGALAYVTIIPAIVFLVVEPYNRNRFVRFHSFQNIFFAVGWMILWVALGIFGHIPLLGWASLLLWPLIGLAGFILWLLLIFKAYQGQKFKLPIIGDLAEKQANTV
jgi:uncharacterized membrane protein